MANPDRQIYRRNPNVLTVKNMLIFGLLGLGLLGCASPAATMPTTEIPSPTTLPSITQPYTDELPTITVVTPDLSLIIPTATPQIITPTPPIPHSVPTEWLTGIDSITENKKRLLDLLALQPDQKTLAEQTLPYEYLQSIVRFKFHHINESGESKLYGGTGTVVAQDETYSYILTVTHVALPSNPTDLTIFSPFSNTNEDITLTDLSVFQSEEAGRGDIAIARVPRIPTTSTFNNFNTTYCGDYIPTSTETVTYVGFPYVDNEYIPVVAAGTVDNVTSPCWIQDNPDRLFLSTTAIAVPSFSGGLVLNSAQQGFGVESAVGPNGAQVIPLGSNTVSTLLQVAGYSPPQQ